MQVAERKFTFIFVRSTVASFLVPVSFSANSFDGHSGSGARVFLFSSVTSVCIIIHHSVGGVLLSRLTYNIF